MIKDKILLDKYDDEISLKCYSCINKDHSIFVCPSLHYIPDSKFIISKYGWNNKLTCTNPLNRF